tara:strand:- start:95 stop:466 length:372 start_codon:yes stop_codon:yes gene_type:complete
MGFDNNKLNKLNKIKKTLNSLNMDIKTLNHLIQGKLRQVSILELKKQTSLNKILQMSKNFRKNEKEKGSGRAHLNYANALKNVTNIDKNMEKIKKELDELRNDKRKLMKQQKMINIERRKIEN